MCTFHNKYSDFKPSLFPPTLPLIPLSLHIFLSLFFSLTTPIRLSIHPSSEPSWTPYCWPLGSSARGQERPVSASLSLSLSLSLIPPSSEPSRPSYCWPLWSHARGRGKPVSGRPPVGDTPTGPSCRLDPPQKTRSRSVHPAAVNQNHQMSVMNIRQDWRTFQFYYFVS